MLYLLVFVVFLTSQASYSQDAVMPLRPTQVFPLSATTMSSEIISIVSLKHDHKDPEIFYAALTNGRVFKFRYGSATPIWINRYDAREGPLASDLALQSLSLSRDGGILALASGRGTVILVDAATGKRLPTSFSVGQKSPLPITSQLTAANFSSDGQFLVAGDTNGFIYLWHLNRSEPIAVLGELGTPIKDVRFSEDGQFLISTNSRAALIWNIESKSVVGDLEEELSQNYFWIEDVYMPSFERYMVLTTHQDTIFYDTHLRKIAKRYQTSPAVIQAENKNSYGPRVTIASQDLKVIHRFHKEPFIESIDLDTGLVNGVFKNSPKNAIMDFGIYFAAVSKKPRAKANYLVGVQTFDISMAGLKNILEVYEYEIPDWNYLREYPEPSVFDRLFDAVEAKAKLENPVDAELIGVLKESLSSLYRFFNLDPNYVPERHAFTQQPREGWIQVVPKAELEGWEVLAGNAVDFLPKAHGFYKGGFTPDKVQHGSTYYLDKRTNVYIVSGDLNLEGPIISGGFGGYITLKDCIIVATGNVKLHSSNYCTIIAKGDVSANYFIASNVIAGGEVSGFVPALETSFTYNLGYFASSANTLKIKETEYSQRQVISFTRDDVFRYVGF